MVAGMFFNGGLIGIVPTACLRSDLRLDVPLGMLFCCVPLLERQDASTKVRTGFFGQGRSLLC